MNIKKLTDRIDAARIVAMDAEQAIKDRNPGIATIKLLAAIGLCADVLAMASRADAGLVPISEISRALMFYVQVLENVSRGDFDGAANVKVLP